MHLKAREAIGLGDIASQVASLLPILNGLATAAAVTRSPITCGRICESLFARYRRDSTVHGLSIPEVVKLCLSAAASRSDLTEWTGFAGEWLTEVAFDDLEEGGS